MSNKLTCTTIYKALSIDQLYRLGILIASYDLLPQSIALRNHIDSKYGVISTDYMQNLIDCENLGKDFPKAVRKQLNILGIDKEVLQLCSILPVDMFYEVEEALIKDDKASFQAFEQLQNIKYEFNKLTRSVV